MRAILILSARYGTHVGSGRAKASWKHNPYAARAVETGRGAAQSSSGAVEPKPKLPSCVDCRMTLQFLAGTFSAAEMESVANTAWARAGSPADTRAVRGRGRGRGRGRDGSQAGEHEEKDGERGTGRTQAGVEIDIDVDTSREGARAQGARFSGGATGRGPWRGGSALRVHAKPLSSLLGVYNPSLVWHSEGRNEREDDADADADEKNDNKRAADANSLRVRWVEGFPSKPVVFEATFYDMEEVVLPAPRGRAQCLGPWDPWREGGGVE